MKFYKIAKKSYLEIGHHENSEAWGFGYDDNWIVVDRAYNAQGDVDLHGDRDDFMARGRIDHETKEISFVLLGYTDEEDKRKIQEILRYDYPGYKILEY